MRGCLTSPPHQWHTLTFFVFAFCFAPNLRPIIAAEEAISNLNETPSRSPARSLDLAAPHDRQDTPCRCSSSGFIEGRRGSSSLETTVLRAGLWNTYTQPTTFLSEFPAESKLRPRARNSILVREGGIEATLSVLSRHHVQCGFICCIDLRRLTLILSTVNLFAYFCGGLFEEEMVLHVYILANIC